MKSRIALYTLFVLLWSSSCSQLPLHHWDFEGQNPLADKRTKQSVRTANPACPDSIVPGLVGNAIVRHGKQCFWQTNVFGNKKLQQFSIEFMFKGEEFYFTSLQKPYLRMIFAYDYLQFVTTTQTAGEVNIDNWIIRLRGSDILNYSNLAD